MSDGFAHVVVVNEETREVIFEGKVSVDVSPAQLRMLGCFRELNVRQLCVVEKSGDKCSLARFQHGSQVELVLSFDHSVQKQKEEESVLFKTFHDGVLRATVDVLSLPSSSSSCSLVAAFYLESASTLESFFFSSNTYLTELDLVGMTIEGSMVLPPMVTLEILRLQKVFLSSAAAGEKNIFFSLFSSLKQFYMNHCSLEFLPESLGEMPKLEKLTLLNLVDLKSFSLDFFVVSVLLKVLILEGCGVVTLPLSVSKLENLQKLQIGWSNAFQYLPEEFGNVTNLRELRIFSCGITHFPQSMCKLNQLRSLSLKYLTHLQKKSENEVFLGYLTHLEELCIVSCSNMGNVVKDLHKFPHLRSLSLLYLQDAKFHDFSSFCQKPLRHLHIQSCPALFSQSRDLFHRFCRMLEHSVKLKSFYSDCLSPHDEDDVGFFLGCVRRNGSIVCGNGDKSIMRVYSRNKLYHARAQQSAVCLLAIGRRRISQFPKEIIVMLAKMLLETKCDILAWKKKY